MAKGSFKLGASSKAIDPTLDALFASSSGPIKPHPKSKYADTPLPRTQNDHEDETMEDVEGSGDDEVDVEAEIEKLLAPAKKNKDRKRKRNVDDLESKYLNKLAEEEEREEQQLKKKRQEEAKAEAEEEEDTSSEGEDEEAEEDDEEASDEEAGDAEAADTSSSEGEDEEEEEESGDESDASEVPVHESLSKKSTTEAPKNDEVEKANRTVFLSNVAIEASTDKSAKRDLMAHLASALPEGDKVETIRFRSLAFSTGALPKRAAYITAATMESTTKSANAYVVYSSPAAARAACAALNGTVVLDRHLRVDSVAHPSATDHRRCVFVGNLGFVDDETVVNTNAAGETTTRKRTKIPSDTEEGLWRTFTKNAGKVENVRVIRDPKTRVGKGFAYVQFYDENSVEAALLLDGKKYPPMLPRILRVTRAKAPHKTALAQERKAKAAALAAGVPAPGDKKSTKYKHKATPEQQSMAGRAGKLLGRSGGIREARRAMGKPEKRGPRGDKAAARGNGSGVVPKTPEQFIFEGRRARAGDGVPNDVKVGGKKRRPVKKGGIEKPGGRGVKRAQEWRKLKKDKA
ncbi:nucleolar protein [Plectosphaerella plurivora]|uniref:Nucleolar protein 12 n=1 Tax=Plectosphaerella plurivora TaxID=936078 RepID=A0A9P8V8P7_9PEZI|nr:nucleolar protein [Plectosphaerella plurivora]